MAPSKTRIIAFTGFDKYSRQTLASIRQWQRALDAHVQLIVLRETLTERPYTLDVGCFATWATQAEIELEDQDIKSCGADGLEDLVEDLFRFDTDLLVLPGNRDPSAVLGTINIHALWNRIVAAHSKLLLSCGESMVRNVLVVSDGSPDTEPVLKAAFDLTTLFDVHLGHLDARLLFPLVSKQRRRVQTSDERGEASTHSYLSALHMIVDTVSRAPRKVRPDLLLLGAPGDDGGATASALAAKLLPCSVLLVPL